MINTAENFFSFISHLQPELSLPEGIALINPYSQPEVKRVFKQFCKTFYNSNNPRILILGINPGRYGGGITGISFTDPIALERECGIENSFEKRFELSSRFIYEAINSFGGPSKFYNSFLLSAVCPLGFTKGKKNFNYYDSAELFSACRNLICESLIAHSKMNINTEVLISLGKKNASVLESLNKELKLFGKIVYLEHPRFIMQYKLKSKADYINSYLNCFHEFTR